MRTDDHAHPRSVPARRALGGVFALVVVAGVAGGIASLKFAWVPPGIEKFGAVARAVYQPARDPISSALQGLSPEWHAGTTRQIKAIHLTAGRADLLVGGRLHQRIAMGAPLTLPTLTRAVADPAWLEQTGAGTFTMSAALVVGRGARLEIAAPAVTQVVLDDRPGVLLGAWRGGRLAFDGVSVQSNAVEQSGVRDYRPFVLANAGAAMTTVDSTFSNLGWDWNGSYGVAWASGATGGAVRTAFERNFIGVYTSKVKGLRFVEFQFRHNDMYGLDPHTGSTGLVIEKAVAEGNKSHGIVFSQDVTDSVVRHSISRGNGQNGIMMDARSSRNLVEDNTVEANRGDGIVTATSGGTRIHRNLVRGNRIGMRIDPFGGDTNLITDNRIEGNRLAHQGPDLSVGNRTRDNGGQWRTAVLPTVWIVTATAALVGIVLLLIGSSLLRRRVMRR